MRTEIGMKHSQPSLRSKVPIHQITLVHFLDIVHQNTRLTRHPDDSFCFLAFLSASNSQLSVHSAKQFILSSSNLMLYRVP